MQTGLDRRAARSMAGLAARTAATAENCPSIIASRTSAGLPNIDAGISWAYALSFHHASNQLATICLDFAAIIHR